MQLAATSAKKERLLTCILNGDMSGNNHQHDVTRDLAEDLRWNSTLPLARHWKEGSGYCLYCIMHNCTRFSVKERKIKLKLEIVADRILPEQGCYCISF